MTGKHFPGPGAYEAKSTVATKEKGKSFGREGKGRGDSKERHLRSVPGPGQYSVSTSYIHQAAPRFGKEIKCLIL